MTWFKKKAADLFSSEEKEQIVSVIKNAEHQTSGEIRVYIESDCPRQESLERAIELFGKLEMYKTKDRNGVLVYVAIKAKKLAIYGDAGIYEKEGKDFWNQQVTKMLLFFNKKDYSKGIAAIVEEIGEVLKKNFPYDKQSDINELPDEIIFGK